MEIWKTLRVSHISTPPTATTNYFLKRRYTNIPLGTKDRSDHPTATTNYFLKRRYTNIPLGTKDRSDHSQAGFSGCFSAARRPRHWLTREAFAASDTHAGTNQRRS